MNYKKMTFRASMLGLIVMLFAGLVSCSSDDDDKNIPVEETKVPTTGAIVFLYAATEDELSICDMIAEYTDENGATKTEGIPLIGGVQLGGGYHGYDYADQNQNIG